MPVSKYYGGHGSKVMKEMQQRYGKKHGKEVFYATANKKGQTPTKHSLHDIDALDTESKPGTSSVELHQMSTTEPGDRHHASIEGCEKLDNSYRTSGVARDIPVDCYGPDSQFSVQEIDPATYGRDYDPLPDYGVKTVKKLHKKEDEQEDHGTIRQREEWEFEEESRPGAFPEALQHQGHFRRDEYNKPAGASERQADHHGDFEPDEREDR